MVTSQNYVASKQTICVQQKYFGTFELCITKSSFDVKKEETHRQKNRKLLT